MKNKQTWQELPPMGVSEWKRIGKKWGYWDYFTKQERNKIFTDAGMNDVCEYWYKKGKSEERKRIIDGITSVLIVGNRYENPGMGKKNLCK
jgi:hypothetical protein